MYFRDCWAAGLTVVAQREKAHSYFWRLKINPQARVVLVGQAVLSPWQPLQWNRLFFSSWSHSGL